MIPDEAVEAARRAIEREFPYDENNEYIVRLILEAAAPHMTAGAWERGYLFSYYQERGWTDDGTAEVPEHLTEYLAEWNPHREDVPLGNH